MHILSDDQIRLLEVVVSRASHLGVRAFVVGGVVRDLLLGYSIQDKDLDVIVEADAFALASACQEVLGGSITMFERFGTCKLINPSKISRIAEVDFARTRTEQYPAPGSLPEVTLVNSIDQDLGRRDFSVNAVALPLDLLYHTLKQGRDPYADYATLASIAIDRFNGLSDLKDRSIKVLHDRSFIDDPTRIFRAARYVVRLDGSLEKASQGYVRAAISGAALGNISVFRIGNEIRKVASEYRWIEVVNCLHEWGMWSSVWSKDSRLVGDAVQRLKLWEQEFTPKAKELGVLSRIPVRSVVLTLFCLASPATDNGRRALWNALQVPKQERKLLEAMCTALHNQDFIAASADNAYHGAGGSSGEESLAWLLLEVAGAQSMTSEQRHRTFAHADSLLATHARV